MAQTAPSLETFKAAHPELYPSVPPNLSGCELFSARVSTVLTSPFVYFRRMNYNFGLPFMLMVASSFGGIKGFLFRLIYETAQYYFVKHLKVDGQTYQFISNISRGPWAMKGFMGVVSDTISLCGYRKTSYIAISSVLGALAWLLMALTGGFGHVLVDGLMLFLFHAQIAIVDLLVEARYTEKMLEKPFTGPDIPTAVWGTLAVGQLVAIWIVGPFATAYTQSGDLWWIRALFFVGAVMAAHVLVPLCYGCLDESRSTVVSQTYEEHRDLFDCTLCVAVAAVLNVAANIINREVIAPHVPEHLSGIPLLCWSILIAIAMVGLIFRKLDRLLAKATTYLFLTSALYVSIYPMDTFWLAGEQCIPGGPNISPTFKTAVAGTMSAVFGILSTGLFQGLMSNWKFRPCFWLTTLVRCIVGLWDVVVVMRWNVGYIPDEVMFLVGGSIIETVVLQLDHMPGVVLTSKLCDRTAAASTFAILAACQNFGSSLATNLGSTLIPLFNVQLKDDGPCNITYLWAVHVLGQFALPLVTVIFTFILIPDARMSDGEECFRDSNRVHTAEPVELNPNGVSCKQATAESVDATEAAASEV